MSLKDDRKPLEFTQRLMGCSDFTENSVHFAIGVRRFVFAGVQPNCFTWPEIDLSPHTRETAWPTAHATLSPPCRRHYLSGGGGAIPEGGERAIERVEGFARVVHNAEGRAIVGADEPPNPAPTTVREMGKG
jgi:hypothetical protein